jgi:hypothetical protein
MKILISLVGEQPTPNLIPLFDKRALEGPKEERWRAVHFLASNATRETGRNLLKALKQDKTTEHLVSAGLDELDRDPVPGDLLETVEAWSLKNASNNVQQAINKVGEKYPDDDIVVNFTGGTKIMSLAAYQVAIERGLAMVYVNTECDELLHFDVKDKADKSSIFTVQIPIETQLRATGMQLKQNPDKPLVHPEDVPQELAQFVNWLVENYRNVYELCLKKIIDDVKQKAKANNVKQWQVEIQLPTQTPKIGVEGVKRLEALKLVVWQEADRQVRIMDDKAWAFLSGGWVEVYALVKLAESEYFDEVVGNLEVDGFRGEIDVAVTRNGRLGLVECKTRGGHGEGATFMAAKMRLHESIFGGVYAEAVFALAARDNLQDVVDAASQYRVKNIVCGEGAKANDPDTGKELEIGGLKELAEVARKMLGG